MTSEGSNTMDTLTLPAHVEGDSSWTLRFRLTFSQSKSGLC